VTLPSVTIVGPGRMGLALASALVHADAVRDLTIFGRRAEPPSHPLFIQGRARYVFGVEPLPLESSALFLAVPDAIVPEMAHTVAAHGRAPTGCAAFHLSASLPTEVLAPLHGQGYALGSFHPLQVVTHPIRDADRIPGSYVAVIGAPEAVAVARRLTSAMSCPLLEVPATRRPLFHAATVLASSYLPPLLDLSARLMERAGVSSEEALPALLPLVSGTLQSISEWGAGASVGGPIAAGDVETVALHLRAMDPEDRRLYAAFGIELVRLVGERLDEVPRRALIEELERNR
jgi:predicted short-subunit dehydrogenase-like oxidoreductase (DUF2520 family)